LRYSTSLSNNPVSLFVFVSFVQGWHFCFYGTNHGFGAFLIRDAFHCMFAYVSTLDPGVLFSRVQFVDFGKFCNCCASRQGYLCACEIPGLILLHCTLSSLSLAREA
jgi:hypothetical protein